MSDKTPTKVVAHKIQLLPNNRQAAYFSKATGVARFAWNWGLARWEEQYKAGEKPNGQSLKKEFSRRIDDEWPWMRETTSYAYQRVFSELEMAWKRYFKIELQRLKEAQKSGKRGKHKPREGMPKFKVKGKSRRSFYIANTCFSVDGRYIKIQKLGWVRMRHPLRFHGKLMSARISEDAGKWFVSIAVEQPAPAVAHKSAQVAVGVDFGVKALATLSNGESIANPRAYSLMEKRKKRVQRQMARQKRAALRELGHDPNKPCPKGVKTPRSNRYRRNHLRLRKIERRIAGIRSNAQHQLSASLTKRFGIVAIEDLNVRGMTASAKGDSENPGKRVKQKAGLNRSILDVGFGELRRQITYKAERTGAQVAVIDRWMPSTKACSACGSYQPGIVLGIEAWTCPDCGVHHDRDHNAAKNIKAEGLRLAAQGIVKKERVSLGRVAPRRKQSSDTRGARGIEARGAVGNVAAIVCAVATSRDEARTQPGTDFVTHQTGSSRQSLTTLPTLTEQTQLFDSACGSDGYG